MASKYRLIVAPRVQDQIDDQARWWRKGHDGSRPSFGKALITSYALIKQAPKLGVEYQIDGFLHKVWTYRLLTGHILYYRLVYQPPLPTCIRVIGIAEPDQVASL